MDNFGGVIDGICRFFEPIQTAGSRIRETWNAPKMEVKILAIGILAALVVSQMGWMKSINSVKILNGRIDNLFDTFCPLSMSAFAAFGVYSVIKLLRKPEKDKERASLESDAPAEATDTTISSQTLINVLKKTVKKVVAKLKPVKKRGWDVMPIEARILVFVAPLAIVLWQTGIAAKFNALSIKGRELGDLIEVTCMAQLGAMMTWGALALGRTAIFGAKKKQKQREPSEASSSRAWKAVQKVKNGCNKCYSEKFEVLLLGMSALIGLTLWASGGFQSLAALMAKKRSALDLFSALCAAEIGGVALWGAKRLIWPKSKKKKEI